MKVRGPVLTISRISPDGVAADNEVITLQDVVDSFNSSGITREVIWGPASGVVEYYAINGTYLGMGYSMTTVYGDDE